MTWKKGQSGNPSGRPLGATADKPVAQMLISALHEVVEKGSKTKLRAIIDKWIEAARNGESWAIVAIADRLDGKPAQESTVNINSKHDAAEYSRAELIALLEQSRHRDGGDGTAPAHGRDREPDSVH